MSTAERVSVEDLPPLANEVGQAARPAWPVSVSAAQLCASPPQTPPILIEGILYRGGTLLLAGPSKAHKTFTLLDLAIALATGSPWLGFETVKVPVLYLNLELPVHVAEKRIRAICARRGIAPPAALHLWNLRGNVVTLGDLIVRLPDAIAAGSFGAVIIDPHYKVSATSGAEENSNDSQGQLLATLEAICSKAGAALFIAHHYAKGDASAKNAIDRASGGGVFARWPDVFMALTPHEEDEAMTVEFIVRAFPPIPICVLRWDYPAWQRADDLDPARLKRAGRSDAHTTEEALAKLNNGMSSVEWRKATGWSDSTFRRKRDALVESGRVRLTTGCYYHAKS